MTGDCLFGEVFLFKLIRSLKAGQAQTVHAHLVAVVFHLGADFGIVDNGDDIGQAAPPGCKIPL